MCEKHLRYSISSVKPLSQATDEKVNIQTIWYTGDRERWDLVIPICIQYYIIRYE